MALILMLIKIDKSNQIRTKFNMFEYVENLNVKF